jgi:PAS domain S-box-containing protein
MQRGSGFELAQRKLVETSRVVGEAFFPVMVKALAETLSARWVLLCTLHPLDRRKARTVAVWDDGPGDNFEYDLQDTPCANIISQGPCVYPAHVSELFPRDAMLREMGAESYVGAPLRSASGEVLGLLAVLDAAPLKEPELAAEMVEVFAGRAAAEIERMTAMSVSERLGRVVEDAVSEAYVFDADTYKFELVNRGARENLGYSMQELRELTPWDLKPEFTQEAFVSMVEPLRSGAKPYLTFETVHRRKDGSLYEVAVRLQLIGGLDNVYYAAIEDITERNKATAALRETSRRLDAILNNTKMAVFMMDDGQRCVFMNSAAEALTGFTLQDMLDRRLHDVIHHTHPDGRPFPIEECAIDRAFPQDSQVEGEEVFVHKDGSFYPVAFTASPIRDDAGRPIGTIVEARNIEEELRAREALYSFNEALQKRVAEAIAERRKTELQLAQAQKMEAVGKLTGGVAHDFNNLLQVIRGSLELLMRDVAGNERAERRVQNALMGASRGAKLAAQLLAFGRRQPLEPRPLNLGRVIRELDDMLRRALGEGIEIETVAAGGLWNCLADPTQVENAVLNLAINSRDAMGGRGKLTIEVGNASLDDEYAALHPDVAAGQYVLVAVTDTGCGIPPDKLDHVFEPFFTTKPEGEGTGLGLSMVYGFARQSGGHVKIYSEIGHGTTVRLYLPRTRRPEDHVAETFDAQANGGVETILVVEDDDAVRDTATEMLTDLGYKVLKARDADSALAIVESGAAIDLLFTDVVMPGKLRSTELADRYRARTPHGAVLYTSGYTQNAIVHAGRLDEGVELLSKPYSREALARKVRLVLDPRCKALAERKADGAETATATAPRSVLLVEDEALIRLNTADMLMDMKLDVSEAATVQEARSQLARRRFDVLVTDLSLPDGSGMDVAREAMARHPTIHVVFASGRSEDWSSAAPNAVWLPKPYDYEALALALAPAR